MPQPTSVQLIDINSEPNRNYIVPVTTYAAQVAYRKYLL